MIDINGIRIDPDVQAVLRKLTDDERGELEADIEQHGFRCPLVVWLNFNVLLDGHNRVDIWETKLGRDPDREPETVEYAFADKAAAIAWVKRNQCARRNLTREEVRLLRATDYREQKQARGGDRKSKSQAATLKDDTATRVAKKHGVDRATVHRDAKWLDSVDAIAEKIGPEAEQKLMSGELKATDADLHAIAAKDNPTMADLEAADRAKRKRRKKSDSKAEHQRDVSDDTPADDFLRDAAKGFTQVTKEFNAAVQAVKGFAKTPHGNFIRTRLINRVARETRDELRRAVPAKECQNCKSRGCILCSHVGFLPANEV